MQPNAFVMTLPVELSSVDLGRLALLAYIEPLDLAPRVVNRLEVVLEELVTNIVRHSLGAATISIEAEPVDDTVRLTVGDDGAAFNPLEAPMPEPVSSLQNAVLGGQGILLIRRMSKVVRYDRIDGANRMSVVIAH
jgi:serine/threonine-protein kinase RsbW